MRKIRVLSPLILLPILIAAAQADSIAEALRSIRTEQLRAHILFLADDLLEGRAPGSRGAALAARYIATRLAASGVEPLRNSWLHPVPLVGWRPDARRMNADFARGDQRVRLRYPNDAILWTEHADSALARAELVFVGYGAYAPEYNWDDYKNRDIRGRIVVALAGDPPAPPGQPIFDGPALSYYGRYTYKVEEALRRGAAGLLLVHTTDGAGYDWNVVRSSWTGEQLALQPEPGAGAPAPALGWLSFDAGRRVLALGGADLRELYVRAARRDFQPLFTGISGTLRAAGRSRRIDGYNVAGVVPGSHPARRGEAVVFTAHYDHLGIGPAVNGDSIYNGAYDNASGVALLLEVAEAWASLEPAPDRTAVFLFTTAEEAGLLGASWYVRRPGFPIDRTVAVLNVDGANLWGETEDAAAVGLERSSLGAAFEAAAGELGLRVSGERAPGQGFFFRSDHFPFARAGVPALYIDHGTRFRDRSAAWSDSVLRYAAERYHSPQDSWDPGFNLSGAVQQGRLALLIGVAVANTAQPPRWYPGGSRFGGATARSGGR